MYFNIINLTKFSECLKIRAKNSKLYKNDMSGEKMS